MADKLNLPTSIVVSCCLFRKHVNYCIVSAVVYAKMEHYNVTCYVVKLAVAKIISIIQAFFVLTLFCRIGVIHCLNKYMRRSRLKVVATTL